MSSLNNRIAFHEMPFDGLTNYEIQINFQSAKKRIHELMDKHGLYEFLTENYMDDLFNPEKYKACDYFDKEKFIGLKRDATNHLNILSLNIRSLPKHGGELVCLLEVLETKFDIIVLTEIGSRNISTVKHLLENYQLYYVIPKEMLLIT